MEAALPNRYLLPVSLHSYSFTTVPTHPFQVPGDTQHLCGENTSLVTPWECTAELRVQLAFLVSTRETDPFSSPAEEIKHVTVAKNSRSWLSIVYTFNSSMWEAEAEGSLSSRSAWSTHQVLRQPKLHTDPVLRKKKKKNNNKNHTLM
jgi:hypothetical protein